MDGFSAEQLAELVGIAALAPSGHNAQPWRFRAAGEVIDVLADRSRSLPVVDPEDRELHIACGAALLNLRLALAGIGRDPVVTLLPDRREPDLLARVVAAGRRDMTEDERALLAAVPRRHTNRSAFSDRQVPAAVLVRLEEEAESEGAALALAQRHGPRRGVAALVARAEHAQAHDPGFRTELAGWTTPAGAERPDGVPASAYGAARGLATTGPFAMRDFTMGRTTTAAGTGVAPAADGPEDAAPVVVAVTTPGDRAVDWLRAGQALQRVLLRATVEGVAASFLNQPLEIRALRPQLRDELNAAGMVQMLLRLGYGPEVPATPRRPAQDLLVTDPDPSV